jgi:replicative DNA helicase
MASEVELLEKHTPPHSMDAEMAVLGSMLLSNAVAERLLTTLREADFYGPTHREILRAMHSLSRSYRSIDVLTVQEELVARGSFERIGGLNTLVQIAESVPSPENGDFYADIVIDRAMLRELEDAGHEIVKQVHDPAKDVEAKIQQAEKAVYNVAKRRISREFTPASRLAVEFFKEVDRVLESGEPMHGLPTGLADVDDLLTGFYPGNLIIVAARPSVGKTSLALWFAYHAARHSTQNVAVFSLEMSGMEIVRRYVTMLGKVNSNVLKRSHLPNEDYQGLVDGCEKLYNLNLYIDDSSDISSFEMLNKCRRLKAEEGGLSLVVVDYLQLMKGSGREETRTQQISGIARGLKMMAKELDVPVVALSQLSRGIELRDPPIPQLSDLRESGSIEADADVVLMLYKAKMDDTESQVADEFSRVMPVDIFVRKNRNGPVGVVTLAFEPSYTLFSNAAEDIKRGFKDRLAGKAGASI